MMRLMNMLMLSCKKASELIDRQLHEPLGLVSRIQLVMHKKMCDGCRAYEKNGHLIDAFLRKKNQVPGNSDIQGKTLAHEVKQRIIKELERL